MNMPLRHRMEPVGFVPTSAEESLAYLAGCSSAGGGRTEKSLPLKGISLEIDNDKYTYYFIRIDLDHIGGLDVLPRRGVASV
jgi:hypothetical protein